MYRRQQSTPHLHFFLSFYGINYLTGYSSLMFHNKWTKPEFPILPSHIDLREHHMRHVVGLTSLVGTQTYPNMEPKEKQKEQFYGHILKKLITLISRITLWASYLSF